MASGRPRPHEVQLDRDLDGVVQVWRGVSRKPVPTLIVLLAASGLQVSEATGVQAKGGGAAELSIVAVDRVTGQPIPGVRGELTRDGETVDAAATDPEGRLVLVANVAGTYDVTLERIGYASATLSGISLDARADWSRTVEMEPVPFPMPEITAAGESRCPPVLDPRAVLALRERIRPYLELVAWADTSGHFVYQLRRTERLLNRLSMGPRPTESESMVTVRMPVAIDDPWLLVTRGFADVVNDTTIRYLPLTSEVLASDAFAQTHCFSIVRGDRPGLRGLAFQPMSGRQVLDVEGVAWVEEETGAPVDVRYEYVHLEAVLLHEEIRLRGDVYRRLSLNGSSPDRWRVKYLGMQLLESPFGGFLEFDRLDNGLWVTRSWRVRGPLVWGAEYWIRGDIDVQPYALGRETEAVVTGILAVEPGGERRPPH